MKKNSKFFSIIWFLLFLGSLVYSIIVANNEPVSLDIVPVSTQEIQAHKELLGKLLAFCFFSFIFTIIQIIETHDLTDNYNR